MARAAKRQAGKAAGRRASPPAPRWRSYENPNVPLNIADPDDDTFEALGASRSIAGNRVSLKKALGYPALWRAVNLISGDVAKLSLLPYRVDGEDGDNRTVDRRHAAYRLLRYKAGPDLLSYHLKQVTTFHALVTGNGYGYVMRAGPRPEQIAIMDPNRTHPVRVKGRVWYGYEFESGEKRLIPAADVLHIRGLGFDGLEGYPVLSIMRDALGAAIAARDHSGRYFRNGARPGGLIRHPGRLETAARVRMRESWERVHRGLDNAHRVAILEEGAEYIAFTGSDAQSAQLLQNREFDAREVSNIFGIPTHKLGDPSKVAYNSLGEENQSYYDDTLSRWLSLWAMECSDKLLSEREKESESHTIDFDYSELKRANLAALVDFANKAVGGPWATADEARALFGWNPLPGGAGRKLNEKVAAAPAAGGRKRRAG